MSMILRVSELSPDRLTMKEWQILYDWLGGTTAKLKNFTIKERETTRHKFKTCANWSAQQSRWEPHRKIGLEELIAEHMPSDLSARCAALIAATTIRVEP